MTRIGIIFELLIITAYQHIVCHLKQKHILGCKKKACFESEYCIKRFETNIRDSRLKYLSHRWVSKSDSYVSQGHLRICAGYTSVSLNRFARVNLKEGSNQVSYNIKSSKYVHHLWHHLQKYLLINWEVSSLIQFGLLFILVKWTSCDGFIVFIWKMIWNFGIYFRYFINSEVIFFNSRIELKCEAGYFSLPQTVHA